MTSILWCTMVDTRFLKVRIIPWSWCDFVLAPIKMNPTIVKKHSLEPIVEQRIRPSVQGCKWRVPKKIRWKSRHYFICATTSRTFSCISRATWCQRKSRVGMRHLHPCFSYGYPKNMRNVQLWRQLWGDNFRKSMWQRRRHILGKQALRWFQSGFLYFVFDV